MVTRKTDQKTASGPHSVSGFRTVSPFVGRAEELHRVVASLTLAAKGQGSTLFLTGHSGIGKTRLAQEALALARRRGFTVLDGCAPPLEAGLAYTPFLDALRPFLRSLAPVRLETLLSGLPSLGHLFEGVALPQQAFLEGLGDPALEKTRLFESILRLLERLAMEAPVALFLDDVHRADPASLDLLYYLARGVPDQRCLLLAAYSSNALDNSQGLQALAAKLLRDGLAEEIPIPRLGFDAVDKLAKGILNGEAPGSLLDVLEARAKGTPLFVEALIAALVDSNSLVRKNGGWVLDTRGALALPPSVRRLILGRLERLTAFERRVLDLIAIMGEAAPYPTLQAASGLEEETVINALVHLQVSGLVSEGMDGVEVTFSITHPLIQEVVYAELTEIVRRRFHMAAIEALERLRPDDIHRLSHHYCAAGSGADRSRALTALFAAGERALALYANEEAARHFEAALAIVRGSQGSGIGDREENASSSTLAQLLERLGEAWERTGRSGVAVEVWKEALVERERAGDVVAACRLHCQLALAEWDMGHFDVANVHVRAGLAALAGHEPCQELLDLLYARFAILTRVGDASDLADTVAELLTVAKRLGSPHAEAKASLAACVFSLEQRDAAKALEHALAALRVGEQAEGLAICYRAHLILATIGMYLGDHRMMRGHAERSLAIAQRLGAPEMEVLPRLRLAYASFLSGAWEDSLQVSMAVVALARRVGNPRDLATSLAYRAVILAFQQESFEAVACIREVKSAFGSPSEEGLWDRYVFGLVDMAEMALALERGEAKRCLAIATSYLHSSASADAHGVLSLFYMPMVLMLSAEAQVAAGEPERALKTSRKLAALGPSDSPYLNALASRAEGHALQAMGQQEAALVCLGRAHKILSDLEMPFEAAKCLLEQAELRGQGTGAGAQPLTPDPAPRGHPPTPAQAAQQSLAVFERLNARHYAERARRLLREFGISPLATGRPRLGGVSVSEREIEIARLVSQGLTAAQIGKCLTLSPLTVNAHLRRLYARLNIGSRTALTRLVIEAGLL